MSAPTTPHRPSGLTWSVLRLHRTALYAWGAALLTAAAVLTWMHVIGPDARAAVGNCGSPGAVAADCARLQAATVDEIHTHGLDLAAIGVTYLLYPVAAWAAAALIGRELESGTAQLAWTQSVTPARWLASKIAVPAVLLAAGTTLAVLLGVWARRDEDGSLVGGWFNTNVFISTGPVAVAYALAGLALGALAGLALRRALPAAGAAVAAAFVLHSVLDQFRMSLWPAVTVTGQAARHLPSGALALAHGAEPSADGRSGLWATYQPESHFWPLQLVESGLLLAVAGLATAAAFALLRRRTP
ncbi:hypothetical protein ACWGKW_06760 [Streptomyces sp. NPDC054766]